MPTTIEDLEKVSGHTLTQEEILKFEEQGYLGPYTLFEPYQLDLILKRCSIYPTFLLPWLKGRHAVVKEMAKTAMHPRISRKLASLLGKDVLLWGSIIVNQKPMVQHPMHVDAEHTAWEGISVWLAMKNVVSGSSFSVVSGSHLFDTSPQKLKETQGLDVNDEQAILEAARKINPNSKLVHLDVEDGQFIIFSGKLWHGTKNTTSSLRSSFILQYTHPASKVRIPKSFKMPLSRWYKTDPLCLLVHGEDNYQVNKLIDINEIDYRTSLIKSLFCYLPKHVMRKIREFVSKA